MGREPLNQKTKVVHGPLGMEEGLDRHTLVAIDKSRKEGTEVVPSTSRGSQSGAGYRQAKTEIEYWYCGTKGHRESECWKKRADSDKQSLTWKSTELALH